MLLGVVTARHLSRYVAVIALFVFLIGPYSEVVPFLAQMNVTKGGNGIDLYPVYDLFKVLPPHVSWGSDSSMAIARVWIPWLPTNATPDNLQTGDYTDRVRSTGFWRAWRDAADAVGVRCVE